MATKEELEKEIVALWAAIALTNKKADTTAFWNEIARSNSRIAELEEQIRALRLAVNDLLKGNEKSVKVSTLGNILWNSSRDNMTAEYSQIEADRVAADLLRLFNITTK